MALVLDTTLRAAGVSTLEGVMRRDTISPIMEGEMEKVGQVRYVLDNKYGEGFEYFLCVKW